MVIYKTYIPAGKKGISLSVPAREKIVLLSGNEAIARGALGGGGGGGCARPDAPRPLHGGARGVRDRHRRRSRTALVPERAGQPALCRRGEDPDAGAVRLLGGEGGHQACPRPLGKIRHPG